MPGLAMGLGLISARRAVDDGFAPAIDQPIITSGAGSPSFAAQTQHTFQRVGDAMSPVDVAGDPKFNYPGVPAGEFVNYPTGATVRMNYVPGGDTQGRRWDGQIETVTASRYLALVWLPEATANNLLIVVNGRPISGRISVAGATGATSHVLLTFPDARERRIKLVYSGGQRVLRMETEAARPPVRPASAGKTLVVIGDSLSAGAGTPPEGATFLDTWPQWAAMALGYDHCCNASIGGSRWVAREGASNINLSHFGGGRLPLALSLAPDAVLFAGSRNDTEAAGVITAAVEAALDETLSAIAVGRVFVTGTFTARPQNAPVQAGAASRGVTFVEMQDGFQAGDIGSDGVHPTYDGAVALRNRIVPRLRAAGCVPL